MSVDPVCDLDVGGQGFLAFLVCNAFEGAHEVAAAHVADDRQLRQRLEPLHEIGADLAHVAADVFALDDLDVLERRGAGHRVPGIGEAVAEDHAPGLGPAHLCEQLVGDDRGSERLVARG